MQLLSQNIAQRANREDNEVRKFWQARYRAANFPPRTANRKNLILQPLVCDAEPEIESTLLRVLKR